MPNTPLRLGGAGGRGSQGAETESETAQRRKDTDAKQVEDMISSCFHFGECPGFLLVSLGQLNGLISRRSGWTIVFSQVTVFCRALAGDRSQRGHFGEGSRNGRAADLAARTAGRTERARW